MPPEGGTAFAAERTMLCDGSILLAVRGVIDAGSSGELLDVLIQGISPHGTVIVDLTEVTYADETGMAALAVADRIAGLHSGELQVIGCTDEAERLLAALRTSLVDTTGLER